MLKPSAGISQFIARVLEQLSLTAWLPSAMLVGVGTLLIQLHQHGGLDLPRAIQSLATQPWGVIIVLIFTLVLVTMVTQAFSFQAIRLLEGYWSPRRPFSWFLAWGVRHQLKLRQRWRNRYETLEIKTFEAAKPSLLKFERQDVVHAWEAEVYGTPRRLRQQFDEEVLEEATQVDWRARADPGFVANLDRLMNQIESYPAQDHRILPTRLGNKLRGYEDRLNCTGRDLEGFVMQSYGNVPGRLMVQHDQFRDRLDMYSTLVIVFVMLGCAAVPALYGNSVGHLWVAPLVGSLTFFSLAFLSYKAAVAAAEGYGTILMAISKYVASR